MDEQVIIHYLKVFDNRLEVIGKALGTIVLVLEDIRDKMPPTNEGDYS